MTTKQRDDGTSSASGSSADVSAGTLERGLALLSLFSAERSEWTLRELHEASGLATATTRRLALTLERLGWLEAGQERGTFVLGPKVLQALHAKASTTQLVNRARPHLERLARDTTESALLSAWGYDGPVTLDMADTPRPFKPFTSVGMVLVGLDTADAEVLTAFSPESTWEGRLDRFGVTGARERERVREALQRVRARGVSFDLDRWRPGVSAVAAPVFDEAGLAIASVSVVLPSERATGGRLEEHSGAVQATAAAISRVGVDDARAMLGARDI